MKFKKITALVLCLAMLASLLSGCGSGTEESKAPASTQQTEATSAAPAAPSSEPAEVEPDGERIVLATGNITGDFNIAFATEEGDLTIARLISPTLLGVDRSGELLTTLGSGVTAPYMGQDYTYNGIADVTWTYDKEADRTVYTIALNDKAMFSDGSAITADDLIFTYYVLCDPSYEGGFTTGRSAIEGLTAYQYNNSMAQTISVTSADINKALDNPTDEIKKAISDEIIRPALREEQDWCTANWSRYTTRFMINSDIELFVKLYTSSVSSDYEIGSKSFDEVFEETVELFGMNYKAIARIYQRDVNYFDKQVDELIGRIIFENRLAEAGGEAVPSISGIARVDDHTVTVAAKGFSEEALNAICNIPVLSLTHCGAFVNYAYDENNFGVIRGDIGSVRAKSDSPLGAGKYYLDKFANGRVVLAPNNNYAGGPVAGEQLTFLVTEDPVTSVVIGNADIADVELTDEIIAAISTANSNGQISGDAVTALLYNKAEYMYFGLNAELLKIGADASSEASLHLRRAFAILLAAARENAARQYGASSLKIAQYPFTDNYEYTPADGDGYYRPAYQTMTDGTPVLENAIESAVEELKLAGYTVQEDNTLAAPEGGKTEFNALVPPYFAGENAMTEVLRSVSESLAAAGITLNVITQENLDEFIIELQSKSVDMWCGKRTVAEEPDFNQYYTSTGTRNYYGLADAGLDQQITGLKALIDRYEAEQEAGITPETAAAPEETAAAPEETTAAPEETTAAPEETTAAPEETTAAPETTAADGETDAANGETTAAPETTAPPEPVTPEQITDAYKQLFNAIMDRCIEVPAYIPQNAVIYNTASVTVQDPVITEYYGLLNVLDAFKLTGE